MPAIQGTKLMALLAVVELAKFERLKTLLGLQKFEALGVLETMWQFTHRNAPRGDIGRFEDEEIAAWIGWGGDAEVLINALVKARWLDRDSTHRLIVHDWAQHCSNATKLTIKRKNESFVEPTVSTVSRQRVDTVTKNATVWGLPVPEPEPEPEPEPVPGTEPLKEVPREKKRKTGRAAANASQSTTPQSGHPPDVRAGLETISEPETNQHAQRPMPAAAPEPDDPALAEPTSREERDRVIALIKTPVEVAASVLRPPPKSKPPDGFQRLRPSVESVIETTRSERGG